ncbi:MAG: ImmA/IrrE family metallo-endopeptidase [Bacillota bacterium]
MVVNANHHRNRQRFTMAHEYYHYLYHRSLNRLVCFTDLQDERQCEREANRFAACFLMPESTVRSVLYRYDLVETAAERMMVSVEALQWRLKELGLLEGMIA